jgi:hypothetical protein
MNAAEKLGDVIEKVDINPKLPIFVEELPDPTINVYLLIEGNAPKAYCINPLLENKEAGLFPDSSVVYHSSFVVRLRAQLQIPGIELFPYVSAEEAGNLKKYLLRVLEKSNQDGEYLSDEVFDCRVFSEAACILYDKGKKNSFPIIKRLAPKHARYTAQVFNNLNIKIEA